MTDPVTVDGVSFAVVCGSLIVGVANPITFGAAVAIPGVGVVAGATIVGSIAAYNAFGIGAALCDVDVPDWFEFSNFGIFGDSGRDGYVDGTTGNDFISPYSETDGCYVDHDGDQIDAGDAILQGMQNNEDSLRAGDGHGNVYTANGDNIVDAGRGNDTVHTGEGDDFVTGGDGADTITDYNTGNTGALRDDDQTNNDFVDLSGRYDNLAELWENHNDDQLLGQSNIFDLNGNSASYSGNDQFTAGEPIEFVGGIGNNSFFTADNTAVVGFAPGTLIDRPKGKVLVERIKVGDVVNTMNGPKTVKWSHCDERPIEGGGDYPILIKAEALGPNKPATDLIVSPQHRVLVGGNDQPVGLTGEQTLVPARGLTWLPRVREMRVKEKIVWWHFGFETHEVVSANDCFAETPYLGPLDYGRLSKSDRVELHRVFGEPNKDGSFNEPLCFPIMGPQKFERLSKSLEHYKEQEDSELVLAV